MLNVKPLTGRLKLTVAHRRNVSVSKYCKFNFIRNTAYNCSFQLSRLMYQFQIASPQKTLIKAAAAR